MSDVINTIIESNNVPIIPVIPKRPKGFQKGVVTNPKGRPKGTRHNLSKAFIEALSKEFDENKDIIIAELRRNPVKYCEILAKLVPQQIQEVKEDPLEDMSEKEIEDFMKNAKKRLKEIDDEE